MKSKTGWKVLSAFILIAAFSMVARSANVVYNEVLVSDSVLAAHSAEYEIDLRSFGIGAMSTHAVYSSAPVSAVDFTGGTQSTGSFTVAFYSQLSTAVATNKITVGAVANIKGDTIYLPGYAFREGVDWLAADSSSVSAHNLANVMTKVPWLSISTNALSAVIYTTTPVGVSWNSISAW